MSPGVFQTLTVFVFTTYLTHAQGQILIPAPNCTEEIRENICKLPSCRCSGVDIPGNLTASDTPQLVFLTFDQSVNIENFEFYKELLFQRLNPNGQLVTATFFITHDNTNYSEIHELWRRGHEIALNSMTHNSSFDYWRNLTKDGWRAEFGDQRAQIAYFARLSVASIKGVRSPFHLANDVFYESLRDHRFEWDCSRPTIEFRKPGMWPYSNDYASTQDCLKVPCPIGQYPGVWTMPIITMLGGTGSPCSTVDTCTPMPETETDMFNLLKTNFDDHYHGNRAPFGIFAHSGYFSGIDGGMERRSGYIQFLDYLQTLSDVYIVSVSRGLEWVKNPTPLAEIATFPPFNVNIRPSDCETTTECHYPPEKTPFNSPRFLYSCAKECPNVYPWLGNPIGRIN